MAKKNSVGQKVIALEGQKAIMYQFIDDLRAISKKMDQRISENEANTEKRLFASEQRLHANEEWMRDSKERIEQNEQGLRESRELSHALTILQGEAFKMVKELTTRTNGHEKRLKKAGM
jgi:serine phosphatase RsbU (regulator of sigma subunit)